MPSLIADWIWPNKDALVLLLLFGGGVVISIVAIVTWRWHGVRKSADRTRLVQEMLARNMSADDITRVLIAAHLSEGGGADEDDE
jgi:hypothetical protein